MPKFTMKGVANVSMCSGIKIFKKLFFLLAFVANAVALDIQDADRFARAGEAYKEGRFQEAYKLYEEISAPTPTVYFNLGNCAFSLNQAGKALWHWRQAEERWGLFDREELENNLQLAHATFGQKADKKLATSKSHRFVSFCRSLIKAFPLLLLQIIFLMFWTLLFVWARTLLRQRKKMLVGFLCCGMLVTGGLLLYRHVRGMYLRAVVIDSQAVIYSGPSTTFQQIGVLAEGQEVRIDKQRQDFFKIRAQGQFGWVARGALGVI